MAVGPRAQNQCCACRRLVRLFRTLRAAPTLCAAWQCFGRRVALTSLCGEVMRDYGISRTRRISSGIGPQSAVIRLS